MDGQPSRMQALTEEYVAYVDAMRGGQYADSDEWQRLSSERILVHDELLRLTGMTQRNDMYVYCRAVLADTGLARERSADGGSPRS